jgi:hypothetical protein
MIIHLELAPDVEAQLRADAARHDAEAVQRLLTEALRPVVETTAAALLSDPAYGMSGVQMALSTWSLIRSRMSLPLWSRRYQRYRTKL